MKAYKRADCRLCGCENLTRVLALVPTPPADSYVLEDGRDELQEEIPLELFRCGDCSHVQIGHVIDAEEVYLNYIYETDSTLGLDSHFKACAEDIFSLFKPDAGGLVIDIGSNDGCLLKYFKEGGMEVLGIDPMPGIASKASSNGIPTLPDFFSCDYAKNLRERYGTASVITSNNLVADTDDLDEFIHGVISLMDENSIFFFETFYLLLQIKNNNWDFTYHEHYSYFTVKPLKQYFEKFGMELIDVKPNMTKGGSIRCTLQLAGGRRSINASVQDHIDAELNMGLLHTGSGIPEVFRKYQARINTGKSQYRELIEELKFEGKKIAGYGASATSTTLIYQYEMSDDLSFLVDDFEAKHHRFSPGHHIPVFPSKKIYDEKTDVIVILAWRYADKIIERHQKFLEDGGEFVIPLPDLKRVRA